MIQGQFGEFDRVFWSFSMNFDFFFVVVILDILVVLKFFSHFGEVFGSICDIRYLRYYNNFSVFEEILVISMMSYRLFHNFRKKWLHYNFN